MLTNTSSTLKSQSVPKVQGYWGRVLGLSDNNERPDLKVSNHYESVKNEEPEEDVNSLKEEISALKQHVKAFNKSLAISRQELFSEKEKYEQELKTFRLKHRELSDLREIIFNQNENPDAIARRETLEKSYSYPYTTRKKLSYLAAMILG